MPLRFKGMIYVALAALLWSMGGLFIKWIEAPPLTILFYRSLFCALAFLVIFRKKVFRINRRILLTSLFYFPTLMCFVMATKLTTSANAILLQYIAPALVLVMEPILYKTQLKRINLVSVLFCFMGMILFFLGDMNGAGDKMGVLLAIVSGFTLAGMILIQKGSPEEDLPAGIFVGNIWVLLSTAYFAYQNGPVQSQDLMMMAFLGVFQLGLGYMLFLKGLQYVTATESALIGYLEPITNPVWVMIGFGEVPGMWSIIGGSVIVLTLILRTVIIHFTMQKPKANVAL